MNTNASAAMEGVAADGTELNRLPVSPVEQVQCGVRGGVRPYSVASWATLAGRAAGERGFTLLEAVIAFSIAALALSALTQGALGGLQSARVSGHTQEAVSRARSRLATLGHGTPLLPGDTEGDDGGGFHWRVRVARLVAVAPPDRAAQPSPGPAGNQAVSLYAVSVGVSWHGDGGVREVVLESQRVQAAPSNPARS
jgi:general secretion pathway protein I